MSKTTIRGVWNDKVNLRFSFKPVFYFSVS